MTRWLVEFGYDGRGFAGYARQPGSRTVEGEILSGLSRMHLSLAESRPRIEVASRTDRGVSARSNAMTLVSKLPGPTLLRALNGIAPDIVFRRAAPVPLEFKVRKPIRRVYRFYEPGPIRSLKVWRNAARVLRGAVDVRTFGRGFSADSPVLRNIDRLTIRPTPPSGIQLEVVAKAFVWGMVRKMMAALREVDEGRLSLDALAQAARGVKRLTLPMADPEGLVLYSVEYPVRWTAHAELFTRYQLEHFASERKQCRARGAVLTTVAGLWWKRPRPRSAPGGIRTPVVRSKASHP